MHSIMEQHKNVPVVQALTYSTVHYITYVYITCAYLSAGMLQNSIAQ